MAGDTAIEWADATWNPIVGCEIVSPGCKHCYAMGQAARIERMAAGAGRTTHYAGTTMASKAGPVWTGKVALSPERALTAPLRWTKPRRIFVNSMGDLFAEGVPDAWVNRVFAVMALAPQHTFIVLTKRAGRMRAWFEERWQVPARPAVRIDAGLTVPAQQTSSHGRDEEVFQACGDFLDTKVARFWDAAGNMRWPGWPLPNVWLGVTAEDQARADERIPQLLETPAVKRIVSVEPMIGPVDLKRVQVPIGGVLSALSGVWASYPLGQIGSRPVVFTGDRPALDWVIVGGESGGGPNVRPMHPTWARQVRDDCAAAGVPFFFKQWGEWSPGISAPSEAPGVFAYGDYEDEPQPRPLTIVDRSPRQFTLFGARTRMTRVGKRVAGGLLDGRQHHAWPETHT